MKEIIYKLPFRKDGEKSVKEIKIDFVPRRRYSDFNDIQSSIIEITKRWNEYSAIKEEITLLLKNKPENFKEDSKLFTARIKEIEDSIKDYADIPDKRLKLVKHILIDNGYKDSELMDSAFWDECVEPETINEFLDVVINKDIDKKKI